MGRHIAAMSESRHPFHQQDRSQYQDQGSAMLLKLYAPAGAVADLGRVRAVQMHPPLVASNVFLRT